MLSELEAALWDLLRQHAEGLGEYDLLRQLQQQGSDGFGPGTFGDDLALYQAHFLLFHALYRLRDHLFDQQQGLLDIHVLNIRLTPWHEPDATALSFSDPLREHYLDLDNLEATTREDVQALLGDFWGRYFADEQRIDALQVLGLDERADSAQIERQYKKLAMQRHPDRGGNEQDFQQLQQAMTVLRRCTLV